MFLTMFEKTQNNLLTMHISDVFHNDSKTGKYRKNFKYQKNVETVKNKKREQKTKNNNIK